MARAVQGVQAVPVTRVAQITQVARGTQAATKAAPHVMGKIIPLSTPNSDVNNPRSISVLRDTASIPSNINLAQSKILTNRPQMRCSADQQRF